MFVVPLFVLAVALCGAVLAQPDAAPPDGDEALVSAADTDEVIVRGRRLTAFRLDVQQARERAYDIFNEINSDDDFDVRCRVERRYFSHSNRRVCRARQAPSTSKC